MSKVLVISGHPDYKSSVANRAILDEFHRLVPQAEIVYLDAIYPDRNIDVETEKRRLVEADTIVFEFPMWWYSAPSLMRRYFETVLTHGFAFGYGGTALKGKRVVFSFTAGASAEAYTPEGYQHYTIDAFLPQFRALASLCLLDYAGEVISLGMTLHNPEDEKETADFYAKTKAHAEKIAQIVTQ